MIQGKGYDLFCGQIFQECFRLVNEYLNSDTSVKLVVGHNISPSSVPEMNSDKDETLPKGLVTQENMMRFLHVPRHPQKIQQTVVRKIVKVNRVVHNSINP